jgi:hypothetical protein
MQGTLDVLILRTLIFGQQREPLVLVWGRHLT